MLFTVKYGLKKSHRELFTKHYRQLSVPCILNDIRSNPTKRIHLGAVSATVGVTLLRIIKNISN